jgi:hypothetical protein
MSSLSFVLASREPWLVLRPSTNPFSAKSGPMPQVLIPIDARLMQEGMAARILRLAFDLILDSTLIGQGEVGPMDLDGTHDYHLTAKAVCPRDALPLLIDPRPGRVTWSWNSGACYN